MFVFNTFIIIISLLNCLFLIVDGVKKLLETAPNKECKRLLQGFSL